MATLWKITSSATVTIEAGVSDCRTTANPVTNPKAATTMTATSAPPHGDSATVARSNGAAGIVVALIAAGVHRTAKT